MEVDNNLDESPDRERSSTDEGRERASSRDSWGRGSTRSRRSSDDSPLAGLGHETQTPESLHMDLNALHGILSNDHENVNRRSSRHSIKGLFKHKETTKKAEKRVMTAELPENFLDKLYVWAENMTSADRKFPLIVLLCYFMFIVLLFTIWWYCITTFNRDQEAIDAAGGEEAMGTSSWGDSIFAVFQLLMAYGIDSVPNYNGIHFVFILINLSGMLLLAVIVAFLTDAVTDASRNLLAGRSRVYERNHTVILGFNEATLRAIVQICFIRRIYQQLNEENFGLVGGFLLRHLSWFNTLMGWMNLLEKPSTSLAVNNIVLMASHISKEEMHRMIAEAFDERGIDPNRSRLGTNIICRYGNPSSCHDLMRICANKAAACLIMMNHEDGDVEDNDGYLQNGATLRVLLALRYVILSAPFDSDNIIHPELRIVVQMTKPSVYINAASFPSPRGEEVVHPLDLTLFANTLMFGCVAHRGLARTFLTLLNMEGKSIRRRRAKNFKCGPEKEAGDCIGRTFSEVATELTDAILIGLVRPSLNSPSDLLESNLGLCPDPGHLIRNDDLLIFVSAVSSPETSEEVKQLMSTYEAEAQKTVRDQPLIHESRDVMTRRNVCVIGWRSIWETEVNRFRNRLDEIFNKSLPGSTLTFVCSLEIELMQHLLEGVGVKFERRIPANGNDDTVMQARRSLRGIHDINKQLPYVCDRAEYSMPPPYKDCKIIHVEGDGALPEIIEPVIFDRSMDTAIVLGTRAEKHSPDGGDFAPNDKQLKGYHRDTRVLSILLLLRKVHRAKGDNHPLHAVGENTEDMTEKLALGPDWKQSKVRPKTDKKAATSKRRGTMLSNHIKAEETYKLPDFVNTQAMYARALVQVLAYPLISAAVIQLFDKRGANLELLRCTAFVSLHEPIAFGLVKALVAARARKAYVDYNGHTGTQEAICLGFITSAGEQHLVPDMDEEITFEEGYRLITITRNSEVDAAVRSDQQIDGDASTEFGLGRASLYKTSELYGGKIAEEDEEEEEEEEEEEDDAEDSDGGTGDLDQPMVSNGNRVASAAFSYEEVFGDKDGSDEVEYGSLPAQEASPSSKMEEE